MASSPREPLHKDVKFQTGSPAVPPSLRAAIDRTVGQSWSQQTEIDDPTGGFGDAFGAVVALSANGTVALIPAAGIAYVFTNLGGSWVETAELTPSSGSGGFGSSVALSANGTTAIVGAPDGTAGDSYHGNAYVFNETNGSWTQTAEFSASDGMQADDFGSSVALSSDGTTAFIGAPGHGGYSGAAYVFNEANGSWTQTAEFTAPGGGLVLLGESVALSADGTIGIASAPIYNSYTGIVYVYAENAGTWNQSASLSASDGMEEDDFGHSVALSANGMTALVGADWRYFDTGVAYLFTEIGGTWTQTAELSASDAEAYDQFGVSVALSANGGAALVGAVGHNTSTGAAYVFTGSGSQWTQSAELTASDGGDYDFFGTVALSSNGTTALVGAHGHNSLSGSAYVFSGPIAPAQALFQPSSGSPGSSTHLLGIGFTPGETVELSIEGLTGMVHADANGRFNIALRVPNVPPQAYTLTATGETSGLSAQATFTVIASGPSPSPSVPSNWLNGSH